MIETYYASHIESRLDASAINVRRGVKALAAPANDNAKIMDEQAA